MAITNRERIDKGLSLTRDGLRPFVEQELIAASKAGRIAPLEQFFTDQRSYNRDDPFDDVSVVLNVMNRTWDQVFRPIFSRTERSYVNELSDVRNDWAHQRNFSSEDTERALDTMTRLLTAVSAPQADEVAQMRQALLRQVYQEQVRTEKRRATSATIETGTGLRPWREVVTPHDDVARGTYQQAEFAADLWQVHLGEGANEYREPVEFFRRTFLTESLKQLLVGAVQRLHGRGGVPVVQLQTNFGGGKTHSMLALYHLLSGGDPQRLPGMDDVLATAGVTDLPQVQRVVLVGNKISPSTPSQKEDGTLVRTLWGELAWQLGGRPAYDRIAADDANATNPGDVLRELLVEYGPSMVLIDEWVAYARQLHDERDIPGGTFETQFTFAQALTEAAKGAGNALLVVSLPASDTGLAAHAAVDEVEVGGVRGREALERLGNVVGRLDSAWRPATSDEGFEIVRRRLFAPMTDDAAFRQRDYVARTFTDYYRKQGAEFPSEAREAEYERRIQAAYPIHPEVFDRLYTDWSSLVKFQRTRGVLRLMAAVIHSLWQNQDANPLIMPATIPIDDPRVRDELVRYLPDQWTPIIEKDVDGDYSLPQQIDSEVPNLGRLAATRRVARTIYLGSAPTTAAATRGLEEQRVRLGAVMPGETPAIFGDALRRLSSRATYLYADGGRYWYSTQPTVTRMADDRAEHLKREPDKVAQEIEARLKADTARRGEFARVHVAPQSGADVQEDADARLVVLGPQTVHGAGQNAAQNAAQDILERRGTTARTHRNTLVFLAADSRRITDLEDATRRYLAWKSILTSSAREELTPAQERQARGQMEAAESTMLTRLPETYSVLLTPEQKRAQDPVTWTTTRLTGSEPLAERASKRLVNDEGIVARLGSNVLKRHMDDVPLWERGSGHVSVRQLSDYFATYLYLPRLKNPDVLLATIAAGPASTSWEVDGFAYAESYDAVSGRYVNLVAGPAEGPAHPMLSGLVVKSAAALAQRQGEEREQAEREARERAEREITSDDGAKPDPDTNTDTDTPPPPLPPDPPPQPSRLTRYHGSVTLDAQTPGKSLGKVVEEVIVHLTSQVGADVSLTLEIDAYLPSGAPEQVVRTVTENGRTLKFGSQGFDEE